MLGAGSTGWQDWLAGQLGTADAAVWRALEAWGGVEHVGSTFSELDRTESLVTLYVAAEVRPDVATAWDPGLVGLSCVVAETGRFAPEVGR
jgi:hypothetical protein